MGYGYVRPPVNWLISVDRGFARLYDSSRADPLSGDSGVEGAEGAGLGLSDASETGLELSAVVFGRVELSGETLGLAPGLITKFNGEAVGADVSAGWVMELVSGSGVAVASWANVGSGKEVASVVIKEISAAAFFMSFMGYLLIGYVWNLKKIGPSRKRLRAFR